MDSQAIATGHAEPHEGHEEAHPAYLRHHFVTVEQQRETASFGMWLFLLTEIMFFGGLFMAYLLYRNWYYDAFVASSNTLGIGLGTTNTAVLILSSFTMAMGVYSAEIRNRKGLLISLSLTICLGLVFLGIKTVEYHDKYVEHHIPGASFSVEDFVHPSRQAGCSAGAGYGATCAALLLSLLCHDRHARPAHDHRYQYFVHSALPGVARGVCQRAYLDHR